MIIIDSKRSFWSNFALISGLLFLGFVLFTGIIAPYFLHKGGNLTWCLILFTGVELLYLRSPFTERITIGNGMCGVVYYKWGKKRQLL